MENERIDVRIACAYIRGEAQTNPGLSVPEAFLQKPLDELSCEDCQQLLQAGRDAELKLYRFKNHETLPRVHKVLGFLKGIQPENLLDVGSGRGVFLFPFLQAFPWVPVTSVDLLEHRVKLLQSVARGGVKTLTALRQDICTWQMDDNSFDVVTLLEVLEHIPDVESAIRAAVRLARRYVIVTVPSKPDDNPEHIHLLTKEILADLFTRAGCQSLSFDGVNGHLFMAARI